MSDNSNAESVNEKSFAHVKRTLLTLHPGAAMWGSVCWTAWILLVYSGEWFGGAGESVSSLNAVAYLFSTTSLAVVFMALTLSPRLADKVLTNSGSMVAAGCIGSIGTLLVILSTSGLVPMSLFYLGNILTGAGTGCIGMKSALWFSGNPARLILMNTGLSLFSAMLVFGFALVVPWVFARIFLVLLPVMGAIFSLVNDDPSCNPRYSGSSGIVLPKKFWRLVVGVFLLMLALSLVRGYYPNFLLSEEFSLSRDYSAVGCLVVALSFAVVATLAPKGFKVGRLCYWVNIGVALLFALLPVVGLGSFVTGSTFAVASAAIFISVWCLMASVAFKSGASPISVFGFGFASVSLGSAAGWWIGDRIFMVVDESLLSILSVVLLVLVIVVCLVIFRQSDLEDMAASLDEETDSSTSFDNGAGAAEHESQKPRFRLKLEHLAKQAGLSEREYEVFSLLARGRNARGIAEELTISYNTARVHVSNVYSKFGVHSRAELQSYVEEAHFEE